MTRKPTEMEERVADALKSVDDSKPKGGLGASYLSLARAAIRAMRMPTTEMLTCGYAAGYAADDGVDEVTEVLAEVVYTAMIRAASPPEE
jgi:hypothetical protein